MNQPDLKQPEPKVVSLRNVSVRRGDVQILNKVDLDIATGQHSVIFGPNGSGKSSLLKLLTRQFYPSIEADGSQGEVKILGRTDWHIAELYRVIGIINATLDHQFTGGRAGRMTIGQAVASGFSGTRLPHFLPHLTGEMQSEVDRVIALVEMESMRDRPIGTLSTGERRRVLIARALVHSPSVLVLDEPTAGLDLVAQRRLLNFIRALAQDRQTTIVLVTHHVEEIFAELARVVVLSRGSVWFDGSVEQAFTSGNMSDLFQTQIKLDRRSDGSMTMDLC